MTPDRQVRLLLRCYPAGWRERYSDEFAELLADDIAERPRSARRVVDVVGSGLVARLRSIGLVAGSTRSGHAATVTATAVFAAVAAGLWSQLLIGWQWARPDAPSTVAAMVFMTVGLVGLAGLGLAGLARALRATGRARLWLLLGLAAGVAFALGAHHFQNGWPGTGGHPWAGRGVVPGGVAAFLWAATLSVSSYWAHPGALQAFPASEVVWMLVSPLLFAAAVGGVARARSLAPARCGRGLARPLSMGLVVVGLGCWVLDGGTGPRNLFALGAIHVVGGVALLASLALSEQLRRASLA